MPIPITGVDHRPPLEQGYPLPLPLDSNAKDQPLKSSFDNHRIYAMSFASVYVLYIAKVEKKGRTKAEVDQVIRWLTGYTARGLEAQVKKKATFQEFFDKAPKLNPARDLITGSICGVKVQEIDHPLMQNIRYMDKLVDELAKGRPMEKVLRAAA